MRSLPVLDTPGCCPPLSTAPLARPEAERLAQLLKAVADPTRLQLLSLVAAAPGREACVCDLTAPLGLSQPTVSHHLKVLTDAGLLSRQRRGPWAYFTLVAARLDDLRTLLTVT
jgi:ArsR family transcriptional regulator